VILWVTLVLAQKEKKTEKEEEKESDKGKKERKKERKKKKKNLGNVDKELENINTNGKVKLTQWKVWRYAKEKKHNAIHS